MTQKDAYTYWFVSAEQTKKIALDTFGLKHYDWALFFWHLALEKTLKGLIVKKGSVPPPVHDLVKLVKVADLSLPHDYLDSLREISTYNIEARYDDYKRSFYKKATRHYTEIWVKTCEEIYLWLTKQV